MNGIVFCLATVVALLLTQVVVSALRRLTGADVHIAARLVVVAAIVAAIDLALRAGFPTAHADVGRFVPLIAAACLLATALLRAGFRAGPRP